MHPRRKLSFAVLFLAAWIIVLLVSCAIMGVGCSSPYPERPPARSWTELLDRHAEEFFIFIIALVLLLGRHITYRSVIARRRTGRPTDGPSDG